MLSDKSEYPPFFEILRYFKDFTYQNIANKLAIGYLSFTLYGLGALYLQNKNLIESNECLLRIIHLSLDYLDKNVLSLRKINSNNFNFSYNPTGFEVAFVKLAFKGLINSENNSALWIKKQIFNNYNFEQGLMNKNTIDRNTLAARIYEIIDLDMKIRIS
jgi:hypothetical protein